MRQAGARQLSKGELIRAAGVAVLKRRYVEQQSAKIVDRFWRSVVAAFVTGAVAGCLLTRLLC